MNYIVDTESSNNNSNTMMDNDEEMCKSPTKLGEGDKVEDIFNPVEDVPDTTPSKLTLWEIIAIQASYSSVGGIVVMPFMFGTLGYILGPMVLALWGLLVYFVATFVCDVVLASEGRCQEFSDVGYELAGNWGRRVLQVLQMLNLLFYLPNALYTIAMALKPIFPQTYLGGCDGWWVLIAFGLVFVISQVIKNFKRTSWLAYGALFLTSLQAIGLLLYGLVTQEHDYSTSDLDLGPSQAFLSPDITWSSFVDAMLTWVFTGTMLLVETMAVAEKPKEYKKALGCSMSIIYILYCIPGLTASLLWGRNFDYQENTDFGNDNGISIALNVTVIMPTLLGYILSSILVNDAFRRRFVDKKNTKKDVNVHANIGADDADTMPLMNFIDGIWHQLKISVPSLVFAFGVAIVTPNMDVLAGLSTSITIVPTITWVLSMMWLIGKKNNSLCDNGVKNNIILHMASIAIGLGMSVLAFADVIEMISTTDFSLQNIWCE